MGSGLAVAIVSAYVTITNVNIAFFPNSNEDLKPRITTTDMSEMKI